ncbi:hypothetical protein [Pseudomonas sp. CGJS7]|uniref:hypothetical protein n=1 Tax=Pseudomonas sp. CGJS7 TaxID=3109348 RepID=UPI00300BC4A0
MLGRGRLPARERVRHVVRTLQANYAVLTASNKRSFRAFLGGNGDADHANEKPFRCDRANEKLRIHPTPALITNRNMGVHRRRHAVGRPMNGTHLKLAVRALGDMPRISDEKNPGRSRGRVNASLLERGCVYTAARSRTIRT